MEWVCRLTVEQLADRRGDLLAATQRQHRRPQPALSETDPGDIITSSRAPSTSSMSPGLPPPFVPVSARQGFGLAENTKAV